MARKLSEISGLEGLDVLVEITPYCKAMAGHPALAKLYEDIRKMPEEERSQADAAPVILEKLIPVWLKDCRKELLDIVKVIDGVTEDELLALGPVKVFERFSALFNDTDFANFFGSFVVRPPKE